MANVNNEKPSYFNKSQESMGELQEIVKKIKNLRKKKQIS